MDGEDPRERPSEVSTIINGLERYNPEAVVNLEDYLRVQCENRFTDSNANRTLLKLYVLSLPRFGFLSFVSFCISALVRIRGSI
jgi:translation initiation factor 3 subunit K